MTLKRVGSKPTKAAKVLAELDTFWQPPFTADRPTPIPAPREPMPSTDGDDRIDVQRVYDTVGQQMNFAPAGTPKRGRPVRVVIYGRCSVDKKGNLRGSSIERQNDLSREMVARCLPQGSQIVGEHADDGISGKFAAKLKALQEVLAASDRREFDVLQMENMDRFGRTAFEVIRNLDRLIANGVTIRTVHGGECNPLVVKIMAILSEEEWRKISTRTRDSRRAYIGDKLRQLGLKCYGYDLVDDKLVINETEAARVNEMFELFGRADVGVNKICRIFESKGYEAPGGGTKWNHVTLLGKRYIVDGEPFRQGGLLCQSTYVGRRVTSLVHYERDEDGNATKVIQDPSQWQTNDEVAPIVSQELWDLARARFKKLDEAYFKGTALRLKSEYLFSERLFCATCGGPLTLSGGCDRHVTAWGRLGRLRCRDFKAMRCGNSRTYNMAFVTQSLMRVVRDWLGDGRADELYKREFRRRSAQEVSKGESADSLNARIEKLTEINKKATLQRLMGEGDADALDRIIRDNKAERDQIHARLLLLKTAPPKDRIADIDDGLRCIAMFARNLADNLRGVTDPDYLGVVANFRRLFETITIGPFDKYLKFSFDMRTVFGNRRGTVSVTNIRNVKYERAILQALADVKGGMTVKVLRDRCSFSDAKFTDALGRLNEYGHVAQNGGLLTSVYRGNPAVASLPVFAIEYEDYADVASGA